jgi:hypothetical protein
MNFAAKSPNKQTNPILDPAVFACSFCDVVSHWLLITDWLLVLVTLHEGVEIILNNLHWLLLHTNSLELITIFNLFSA